MATGAPGIAGQFALDVQRTEDLRLQAGRDPQGALRKAAQQFEALFINMLLKSMREATQQEGILDSDQGRLYQSMFDQQLAQTMATRGIGLADVLVRQLAHSTAAAGVPRAGPAPGAPPPAEIPAPAPATGPGAAAVNPGAASAPARDFVSRVWPQAVEAGRAIGVSPQFLVAQAALETGWGRHELRTADGRPAHNLFNIKAGGRWQGPVVEASTIEYVNGVPQKSVERFRAYGSYAEAFRDYASLLRNNPRYAAVLGTGGDAERFARGLQRAGYATDPQYADKLMRVLSSVTLRGGPVA